MEAGMVTDGAWRVFDPVPWIGTDLGSSGRIILAIFFWISCHVLIIGEIQ